MRKATETKVQEEVEKKKCIEKKKKKKKLKYLKKLQNEVLVKDTENLQVMKTKHKKVVNISSENKVR